MDNLHSKLEDLINELDEEHINKSLSEEEIENKSILLKELYSEDYLNFLNEINDRSNKREHYNIKTNTKNSTSIWFNSHSCIDLLKNFEDRTLQEHALKTRLSYYFNLLNHLNPKEYNKEHFEITNKLMNLRDKIKILDSTICDCKFYYCHGQSLINLGKYADAIKFLNKSLNFHPENIKGQISTIISLGYCYTNLDNQKMAEKIYKKAEGMVTKEINKINEGDNELNKILSVLFHNISVIHGVQKQYDTAINYCLKSGKLFPGINNDILLTKIFGEIGDIQQILNYFTEFLEDNPDHIDIAHIILPLCEFTEENKLENDIWKKIVNFIKCDTKFKDHLQKLDAEVYFSEKIHFLGPNLYLIKQRLKNKNKDEATQILYEQYITESHIYNSLDDYFYKDKSHKIIMNKITKPLGYWVDEDTDEPIYMMKRIRSINLEEAFKNLELLNQTQDDKDLLNLSKLNPHLDNIKLVKKANLIKNGLKTLGVIHGVATQYLSQNNTFKVDDKTFILKERNYEMEADRLFKRFGHNGISKELNTMLNEEISKLKNLNYVAGHGDFYIKNIMEDGAVIDPNRRWLPAENDVGQVFARVDYFPEGLYIDTIRRGYIDSFSSFNNPIHDIHNFYYNSRFFELFTSLVTLGYIAEIGDQKMILHYFKRASDLMNEFGYKDIKKGVINYFNYIDENKLPNNIKNSSKLIKDYLRSN